MAQVNIERQLAQDPPGTLHAGIDLALEKNVVVVINEKAERVDHFSFLQDQGGYDSLLRRLGGLRQKHQAAKVVVAIEPTNYFWKLLARELEEKHGRPPLNSECPWFTLCSWLDSVVFLTYNIITC